MADEAKKKAKAAEREARLGDRRGQMGAGAGGQV